MIREEEKDQAPGASWKYSRSMSWTERPPRKSTTSKPQWNSKARACLPPLQPLSIVRPNIEEWPKAGSDDLGVWPNPPTPGARRGSVTPREKSTSDQPPIEFEFTKDKLAFFNKECSRILDHIYLGSDAIAKNREVLRQNGITHVLNCVGFSCPEYFKNDLVYKTLWLQDCPSEDITSIFYDVFDYFEDVREQGGRVFVHCYQGVSRSTSLVIAYLMWKQGQSFDDAFQHVKAARGVTNPNVGFACQLLQCQKRVHALPASPTSVLRMYRMAPHSPYDPLHLVPKLLSEPGRDKLDSRGAFIVHIPSALYVWVGKHCPTMMSDNAKDAATQVIRYERAQGPVKTVKESEETSEFWDAFSYSKSSTDECREKAEEGKDLFAKPKMVPATEHLYPDQKKVAEYDVDFEIFNGALAGGVVPPFPLSGAGSEMCLPARENGWNRLRKKFSKGVVKELITSSKLNSSAVRIPDEKETLDTCKEVEDFDSPSSGQCESPDSVSSFVISSPSWTNNNGKEVDSDTNLSRSPSFSLVDSFSSFLVNKPHSNTTSPSLSPSTSDISSSFSFSPSSSNWSDLSSVSPQPSPHGLESTDMDHSKSGLLEESVGSVGENTNVLDNATSPSPKEAALASKSTSLYPASGDSFGSLAGHRGSNTPPRMSLPSTDEAPLASKSTSLYPASGDSFSSLAGHRGSNTAPRMSLPSIDEAPRISGNLAKYPEDNKISSFEGSNCSCEVSVFTDGQEPHSVANSSMDVNEVLSGLPENKKYDRFHLTSEDLTNKTTDVHPVVYQWPSMHKIDMRCSILDSRTIYIIHMPAVASEPKRAEVLYVWIGNDVSSQENGSKYDGRYILEDITDRNILAEKGFSRDAQIKMVKEGDEPEQLLSHLACFPSNKEPAKHSYSRVE